FATTALSTQRVCNGKAAYPGGFRSIFESRFCLYSEQMSSILGDNFWYVRALPAVRGGSYGTRSGHLRTSGSQRHGALPCDRRAPGDLSCLIRGRPRGHRLAGLYPAGVLRLFTVWHPRPWLSAARLLHLPQRAAGALELQTTRVLPLRC